MLVSVIIPTCNRLEQLKQCVQSLFSQDFPAGQAEIIVVDDRADKTVEIMINNLKSVKFPVHYFSQESKGPAAARNLGISKAHAALIAFIDDDCIAEKNWLSLIQAVHQNNPDCAAVGGLTILGYAQIAAEIGQFLSTCSIQTQVNQKQETIFFPTCNVSIKKAVFNQIQFDSNFPLPGGEDLEFFWRLFKSGFCLIWDQRILVWHNRDKSIKSFIKQAYSYGRGNYYVQHLHADHPLLKELKTGLLSFWLATIINVLKIAKFSYCLGEKMLKEKQAVSFGDKIKTYLLFAAHKTIYIFGNIAEYFALLFSQRKDQNNSQQVQIPRLLILDITHHCNLQCRICDIWQTDKNEKNLDIESIKKLLRQAQELKIKEIALSGGEPLLREDIFQILDFAQSLKIKNLGILTNGIVLKDKFEKLKPYILDNTIALVISLDSLDPQIHNYIRNDVQAWQNTNEAIHRLLKLKQQYPQVRVNIISIVLNNNLEDLSGLAGYLKEIGVDCLQVQGLLANNLNMAQRKKSEFWISEERLTILDQTIESLVALKKQNNDFIKNSTDNLLLLKKYFRGRIEKNDVSCASADKTVLVSNQGQCTTCFLAYGDVRHKQLKHILKDKQIIAARKGVKNCAWPCLLPCFCDG